MRAFVTASALIGIAVGLCGCGGNSYSSGSGNPTSPTPQPSVSGVVTVNVVAVNGAQSFSPNPATVPAGQMVVWHNTDRVTHRVVLNNGSLDTGDLRAGESSQPMALSGGGGPYHCSIHPSMVGTISAAATEAPSGGY